MRSESRKLKHPPLTFCGVLGGCGQVLEVSLTRSPVPKRHILGASLDPETLVPHTTPH
jgi:hypothetical protein